ncbi:hypothetical protein VcTj87_24670 [Vibrio comitans]
MDPKRDRKGIRDISEVKPRLWLEQREKLTINTDKLNINAVIVDI